MGWEQPRDRRGWAKKPVVPLDDTLLRGPVDPNRAPVAYGYTRVSTQEQADGSYSPEAHKRRAREFFDYSLAKLEKPPIWGDVYYDAGVSAVKQRYHQRPAFRTLFERLRPGDHVIFPNVQRAFRNAREALEVVEYCNARRVNLHFLDLGASTATSNGKMILTVLAGCGEWEAAQISERTKVGLEERARRVGTKSVNPPMGWKQIGRKKTWQMVPDERARATYTLALKLMNEGMKAEEIAKLFSERRLYVGRNRPDTFGKDNYTFSRETILRGVKRCKDEQWTTPPAVLPPPPAPKPAKVPMAKPVAAPVAAAPIPVVMAKFCGFLGASSSETPPLARILASPATASSPTTTSFSPSPLPAHPNT